MVEFLAHRAPCEYDTRRLPCACGKPQTYDWETGNVRPRYVASTPALVLSADAAVWHEGRMSCG